MGHRKKNPATIEGKRREGHEENRPITRVFTKAQIKKNNQKWRALQKRIGNPDWENENHPCHCYPQPEEKNADPTSNK